MPIADDDDRRRRSSQLLSPRVVYLHSHVSPGGPDTAAAVRASQSDYLVGSGEFIHKLGE